MASLWFWIVAAMITTYVVLDGFDLGAGAIFLIAAKTNDERRRVLRAISPVWDGNEVWLIAAGGTLYFAFPRLYASSFSGFYLPLTIVLWLLILRGISIEFRGHVTAAIWGSFWDGTFFFSSLLLAVFFGAALGNVVRGVPLDSEGQFFEALWTNFRPFGTTGILDWYTILTGLTALFALTFHGSLWVAMKTTGPLQDRARKIARVAWGLVGVITIIVTFTSFKLQPHLHASFSARPWGYIFPAFAAAGLLGSIAYINSDGKAFAASCIYLAGMLASVAFGLYPEVLPASGNEAFSLTIETAKAP